MNRVETAPSVQKNKSPLVEPRRAYYNALKFLRAIKPDINPSVAKMAAESVSGWSPNPHSTKEKSK